ncbi:MAG: DUF2795 domain-containing protein [Myxococcota bacterium]
MAFGIGENPAVSVSAHLDEVDYPAWRDQLVKTAMDADATADVINVLKCLPRARYESRVEVFRDLAEAARRFAMGNIPDDDLAIRDRRNIGRDAVEEAPPPHTRHP